MGLQRRLLALSLIPAFAAFAAAQSDCFSCDACAKCVAARANADGTKTVTVNTQ